MARPRLEIGGTCSHGHVLTEKSVVRRPDGRIVCHLCRHNQRMRREGRPEVTTFVDGRTTRERATHCPFGHEYTPENTYEYADKRACKRCSQNAGFRKRYGITIDEYEALIEAQGGLCAICQEELDRSDNRKVHLDHCHRTKIVRGVLCKGCNVGLGHFHDDVRLLQRAIEYLGGHSGGRRVGACGRGSASPPALCRVLAQEVE